jgi:anti-sigma regulatory factor (Ser/Thr protein kinase)
MSENETAISEGAANATEPAPEASNEEITYHAVEKDGVVTAIWEMQGRKHLRTIDPRSRQGQDILRLYTTEHHDETGEAAASQ